MARRFADASPDLRRRARLVAAFALLALVGGTTLSVSHLLWFGIPPEHVVAPLVAGLISVIALPVLLRTRSIPLAGHLVAAAWFIAVGWGIYLRGGLASPPVMCQVATPLIAVAIAGRHAGLIWGTIVLTQLVVMGVVPLPDLMPVGFRVMSNILTASLFGSLLLAMALAQEWLRQTAQEELAASERQKLAAEREAQILRENRLASVGQLAAGVAHEINNPLSYVLGNLEHLDHVIEDAEAREAVRDALDGANRVRTIVRDLKTYSRDDDEVLVPVDLEHVLGSALRMVSGEVKAVARLRTEIGPCPAVLASETRLGQIVINLVVNAAHAFGGRNPFQEIVVALREDASGDAILEVRDNGPGMSPDVLARVTEPFFTTKPVGVGTGLGLPVCENLVHRFRGRMTITSQLGAGTTVSIVLPRAAATAPAPVAAALPGSRARRPARGNLPVAR